MIGEIIQQKWKEVGLTQAQLADRLGVTPPAVNRWEKNLSFPDATLLAPLARLLKTDMNTLFSFYDTLSDMERESTVDEARMTFLKDGEKDGLSFIEITCGVYGGMVHTVFCSEETFESIYLAIKKDLAHFIDTDSSVDEECAFYDYFTDKY